jgi:hypothetical protein
MPAFTVDTVVTAGLERNKVDAERPTEPTGMDRTEEAGILHGIFQIPAMPEKTLYTGYDKRSRASFPDIPIKSRTGQLPGLHP